MAETPSTMLALGTPLPSFALPDLTGKTILSDDFRSAPALLVAFICPHCPYVRHIRSVFAQFASEYARAQLEGRGHQRQRRAAVPRRRPRGDETGGAGGRLHLPVPVRRGAGGGQGLPRGLHARLVPLTVATARSRIAASSTAVVPEPTCPLPATTCVPRPTRCSQASQPRPCRRRASAATLSGSPTTRPPTARSAPPVRRPRFLSVAPFPFSGGVRIVAQRGDTPHSAQPALSGSSAFRETTSPCP